MGYLGVAVLYNVLFAQAFVGAAQGDGHGPRPAVQETIDFYLHRRRERVGAFLAQWDGGARERLFAALAAVPGDVSPVGAP